MGDCCSSQRSRPDQRCLGTERGSFEKNDLLLPDRGADAPRRNVVGVVIEDL